MTFASELRIYDFPPLFLGVQVIKLSPLGLASLFQGIQGRVKLFRTRFTTMARCIHFRAYFM